MYKNDLEPYKRGAKTSFSKETVECKMFNLTNITTYICAFFAARVCMLGVLMPFGIAIFLSANKMMTKSKSVITGMAAIIGYLSTMKGEISISHSVAIFALIIISLMQRKKDKNASFKLFIFAFIINIGVTFISKIFFYAKNVALEDFLLVNFDSLIIVATGSMFCYGMSFLGSNVRRKIFSKEELICISLMVGITIAGMFEINFLSLSIKTMLTFLIIITIAFVEGPAMGSAIGTAMGLIPAISNTAMPALLGIYAFSGLIAGVFRDMGKLISGGAFIISVGIMSFYTSGVLKVEACFLNAILPVFIFLVIPVSKYERLSLLLNPEKRDFELQKSYMDKVKDLVEARLKGVSNTLSSLSEILQENINNQLSKKTEISSLIERLADKVCDSCECKEICWKREIYYTYDGFNEMYRMIEKTGRLTISDTADSLKRKCIKLNELVKQANYIFEIFKLNNNWKNKLINSRGILAEQICGISNLVEGMMEEVAVTMEFKNDIEEELAVELDKRGLSFEDVLAIKNKRGKYELTIYRDHCLGHNLCSKGYISAASKVIGVKMSKQNTNCTVKNNTALCQFKIVESLSYNVTTAVARLAKDEVSGDTSYFGEVSEGRYMIALSDGMGSGVKAAKDSGTTISLLEKYIEAGFERNTAIRAINSVLALRSLDESFSTIDLSLIDLYSGVCEFIKIASAPSFIISGFEISVINNCSLPVGILEELEIESEIIQLKNGDIIVTISDGILDAEPELKEKWIITQLKMIKSGNPTDIAEELLRKAKLYYGKNIKDDMTVMVSKLWKNY